VCKGFGGTRSVGDKMRENGWCWRIINLKIENNTKCKTTKVFSVVLFDMFNI
jgi:hypothetical protein